jgi:CPA2 family monovalent cation:H+ antiporter-2
VSTRSIVSASVIALIRQGSLEANPKASTMLTTGDILGLIGNREQIAAAEPLFAAPVHDEQTSGGIEPGTQ